MYASKSLLALLALAVSSAVAQSTTSGAAGANPSSDPTAGISPCILGCIAPAAQSVGCTVTDVACICASQAFQVAALTCLTEKCTPEDQAAAIALQAQQCAAAPPASSTLAAVRAANATFDPSYVPVAIFVGGTSGIGQGLAEAFARHTKGNAHIVIIGRNRAAADAILAQFPKPVSEGTVSAQYTHEDFLRIPKINFLVMSPGILAVKGRDETTEAIDKKLAVHYYARWKFIDGLLPALRRAK
ncbi:hypothetical protein DXG03_008351 [Asterophora parasitica]|uniref:CFEM domain-containing protein n=1 Tax=Asterophora parasitica TaxID=117018 RepID=A0A9P7GC10_9AGAR|nr:hypothetical protein DXG03_008351 [Asterophora parasitica]